MHVVSSVCKAELQLAHSAEDVTTPRNKEVKRRILDKNRNESKFASKYIDDGFSAEKFVDRLLNEGCDITCDENSKPFNEHTELPPYYDEQLYKKGQQFFYKHLFGLFMSKFLGLVMLLALDTVKLLSLTNKSSTPLTAYKRYLATIFHMLTWYDDDFRPESTLRSSIAKVKNMHNAASKLGDKKINYQINQKDMALTQFGFMGFGTIRSKMMGVHDATDEELKGFIHLWRVIGYLLGIDDKYNICRDSVAETKEICQLLVERAFRPAMEEPAEEFESMSKALVKGMWVLNPFLQYDTFLCYLHMVLENTSYDNLSNENVKQLSGTGKRKLKTVILLMWALQFTIVRLYLKYLQIVTIWLMRKFPFLAYYRYGRQNSHVTI